MKTKFLVFEKKYFYFFLAFVTSGVFKGSKKISEALYYIYLVD